LLHAIGDKVVFENVVGMTEINGLTAIITAVTLTTATVDLNTLNFTPYVSGGSISRVIQFQAEMSPFNPYRDIGRKCYVSHVEVLLNTHNAGVYVDIFEDEEESPFKTVLLQPSSVTTKQKEWINFVVNEEANFISFVFRNDLWKDQILISSMRIHCNMGAFTSS
jgi:hypothetical protein